MGAARRKGDWNVCLLVSPDGEQGSLLMHQDAKLYAGLFDADEHAVLDIVRRRRLYVHVVRGEIEANGVWLLTGDALRLVDITRLTLEKAILAEVLVFDLPGP